MTVDESIGTFSSVVLPVLSNSCFQIAFSENIYLLYNEIFIFMKILYVLKG